MAVKRSTHAHHFITGIAARSTVSALWRDFRVRRQSGLLLSAEVRVLIDPTAIDSRETSYVVATKLGQRGGQLVAWRPATHERPAEATYRLASKMSVDHFVRAALETSGVSIDRKTLN
jgi:hypothetical protein